MVIMSSVSELRVLAKTLGVRGYSVAKKADLIQLIEQHQNVSKPKAIDADVPEVPVKNVKKEKAEKKEEKKEAPVQEAPPVAESKVKRSNEWNSYLAEYRKEHNVTLRQAMAEAKESYVKHKEAKKTAAPTEERPFRDLP